MRLTFVTENPGKLAEVRRLLAGVAEVDQDTDGYTEPQIDTLEEVASHGLRQVGRRLAPPFFLEDSGLFVDALKGFPGVYSAYVLRTIGWAGVLRLLDDLHDHDRTARFSAVIGYRDPKGTDHLFRGEAEGRIARTGRGEGGFGFDPIFVPADGDGRTFAEMTQEEKSRVSHRGVAIRALIAHLEAERITKKAS